MPAARYYQTRGNTFMEEKKISLIIPVYNAQRTLERCIESALAQSYKNLEIILVNDGSTDRSGEICDSYAEKDKRIKVIHKQNGGVSQTRNAGLAASTGYYIQFADSDDALRRDFCRIMAQSLEQSGKSMAVCGYHAINATTGYERDFTSPDVTVNLKEKGASGIFLRMKEADLMNVPWNKLFIRDKIKTTFREDIALGEDGLFILAYMEDNPDFIGVEEILYDYYIDIDGSLSRTYSPQRLRYVKTSSTALRNFCDKMFPCGFDKIYVFNSLIKSTSVTIDWCLKSTAPFSQRYRDLKTIVRDEQIKEAAVGSQCERLSVRVVASAIKTQWTPAVLAIAEIKILVRKLLDFKGKTFKAGQTDIGERRECAE